MNELINNFLFLFSFSSLFPISQAVNGKMTLHVHWESPAKTDLPISKYKIFWSRRLTESAPVPSAAVKERKGTVNGNVFAYKLTNLDANAVYFVQVQAMITYGEEKLRSEKSQMLVNTFKV